MWLPNSKNTGPWTKKALQHCHERTGKKIQNHQVFKSQNVENVFKLITKNFRLPITKHLYSCNMNLESCTHWTNVMVKQTYKVSPFYSLDGSHNTPELRPPRPTRIDKSYPTNVSRLRLDPFPLCPDVTKNDLDLLINYPIPAHTQYSPFLLRHSFYSLSQPPDPKCHFCPSQHLQKKRKINYKFEKSRNSAKEYIGNILVTGQYDARGKMVTGFQRLRKFE